MFPLSHVGAAPGQSVPRVKRGVMETAGPAFVLVEVLAWGLKGLNREAPCCGPCAITLWWSLVPWMDQGLTVPEEATSKCLLGILGGRQPGA